MREFSGSRRTNETNIEVSLKFDEGETGSIDTGIGFFDHMLQQVAKHGQLQINIKAEGDLHVDDHHTIEDVGLLLGRGLLESLGDKKGIKRYSTIFTPMDDALSMVSIDFSGRPYLHFDVAYRGERVGEFEVELVEEFFRALAMSSAITLHIRSLYGKNNHHMIETIFKAFGRALREATTVDPTIKGVLSTKGTL
ncbi:imidazoleglycerol-phosphate dehydratase HisB [Alkaliphilus serpentinus]|uniref:Imidazoleglycerol-phosphate dehydratase n=1 Tax=Alkaliphilus serpentinus TaxID=1482731 RepID=A0A833HR06_9FIRM|nr:imidazoleglycerol-phosphate dehydratase HisB [Alkaliphilus serpentinus]KAB3532720.1 imidazoleglycerol-phosphate dehydratase HisB [Alkaliphilus serpentinus]